jgi:hypothetical protein
MRVVLVPPSIFVCQGRFSDHCLISLSKDQEERRQVVPRRDVHPSYGAEVFRGYLRNE